MKPRILAIDDDPLILGTLRLALSDTNFELEVVETGNQGIERLKQFPLKFILVLVDYKLSKKPTTPEDRGDFVVRKLKEINPSVPVVVISGDTSQEALKAWLAAGVDKFLYKPFQSHQIVSLAEDAFAKYNTQTQLLSSHTEFLQKELLLDSMRRTKIVGISDSIGYVARDAIRFANEESNVLILGETGTGKELIAKAIHENSKRIGKSFVAINCSTYTGNDHLLESELFGYEKGAFTGADKATAGIFESGQGGTVFLDEIHHLSPPAQAKLLRVVQEKKVRRVGGKTEYSVDFRLIAAAKPFLRKLSDAGEFLPDLYFRLNQLELLIAPLRDRPEDIKPLLFHFKSLQERKGKAPKEFLQSTFEKLTQYSWPGNVRELQILIERLYVTVESSIITPQHLPGEFIGPNSPLDGSPFDPSSGKVQFQVLLNRQEQEQRELVNFALTKSNKNVSRAAELLGIPRTTLTSLMKRLEISEDRGPRRSQQMNLLGPNERQTL